MRLSYWCFKDHANNLMGGYLRAAAVVRFKHVAVKRRRAAESNRNQESKPPGSEFLRPGPVPTGNTRQFGVTDDGHTAVVRSPIWHRYLSRCD